MLTASIALHPPQFSVATHNGTVTIHNPATGNHRTFRIRTQPADAKFAPGERIVSLLTGSDNESDYTGFGFVANDGRIRVWASKQAADGGVFVKFADMLTRSDYYESLGCRYLWAERCRKCNRRLTTPESVATGLGPKCQQR